MASFDWYEATVPAPVDDVLEACFSLADSGWLTHSKGKQAYAHQTTIESSNGSVGQVWHGGQTHARPHVLFTGGQAEDGSKCIRASFPEHFVSRADACLDFIGETVYERIQAQMVVTSREKRVRASVAGDHFVNAAGRSFNLGSNKSAAQAQVYEKTAEQRVKFAADPVRLAAIPADWVRLEARVSPATVQARAQFASIEPLAVMGSTAWLRFLMKLVVDVELEPVQVGKPWRQSDDDRAYAFMLMQYGGLLERKAQDHGSWCALGKQIEHDLVERAKAKRNRGR